MRTGDLCNVLGYLDTGRITAIRDERVTVELKEGLLEVHESAITRTWVADGKAAGDYFPKRLNGVRDEEIE